jgi:hypothetical protein
VTDLDDRVRTLLETRARDVAVDPEMPETVGARSRRRRAAVGTGVGLAALVVVLGGAAALRTALPEQSTGTSPTPPPVVEWRGIWPQTSRVDAEAAQLAADRGDAEAVWQIDAAEVLDRYARRELGFEEVHLDGSLDLGDDDAAGPVTVHVISCEPRDAEQWPPACAAGGGAYAEITIERLLRADPTGLWFVTDATDPTPTEIQPPERSVVGYPESYVAMTNDRDLVLVRLDDGKIVRTLLEGVDEITLGPGAVTPDGTSVYVTDRSDSDPQILRVPVDGGPIESIDVGTSPTVGPDGRLAYGGCGRDGCASELFVQQLGGGLLRVDVSAGEERLAEVVWLPDGRLAFSIGYLGDADPDIRILDPSDPPQHLIDLPVLGPTHPGEGWRPLGFHEPTGGLAVDASCCPTTPDELPLAEPILSVDPDTGEHGPGIVEGAGFAVALDHTGRWFLLVGRAEDGTGGTTFLLDADGQLRAVGEGFVDVAW